MAIPRVYHPVKPQDFTLTPITVHKEYVIQKSVNLYSGSTPVTQSGYKLWESRYLGEKLKISSSTYPTNSWDGTYQHIIWNQIDSQYYRFPYDKYATLEHANSRFTQKFLNYSASVIVIPQQDFGESIEPGSVQITSSAGYYLSDDGNGNLYTPGINTGSFASTSTLVGHWSFDNEFRGRKPNNFQISSDSKIRYSSKVFSVIDGDCIGRNLTFSPRTDLGAGYNCGLGVDLNDSYILTKHRKEFNLRETFTIAFWVKIPPTQSDLSSTRNTILSKRGVVRNQVYGNLPKYNQNDILVNTVYESSSLENKSTDVYPFHFEVVNSTEPSNEGILYFYCSDGSSTYSINTLANINDDQYHHVAVTRFDDWFLLYIDGSVYASDNGTFIRDINNKHDIIFGAENLLFDNSFSGSIDEVRIYNTALSEDEIITLATRDQSVFQTAAVGNVFYRRGTIVLGGQDTTWANIIRSSDFTLKFKNTHTIFQYETLVRIPQGSFNLSQNPSSLQHSDTDLIINDMTGSLEDGALFPYATQIGLYNENAELMAIAKLSQPLQMRDDVDISIIVKFDT